MLNAHHRLLDVGNVLLSLSALLAQLASISMVIFAHLAFSPLMAAKSVMTQLTAQHVKVVSTWIHWEPINASSVQLLLLVAPSVAQTQLAISVKTDTI